MQQNLPRECHGKITPRKVTFVQSRVYYVTRDSREHVKEKIGLEPHVGMMLCYEGKLK